MTSALRDLPWHLFGQLTLAIVLGAMVGLEREVRAKGAGLRTHAFVTLGATLFTIVSIEGFRSLTGSVGAQFDPSRIVQAVATGIGFLGGGIIIQRGGRLEGVTTAAGLWVVAALGIAVGMGLYAVAIFTAAASLAVFEVLPVLCRRARRGKITENEDDRRT